MAFAAFSPAMGEEVLIREVLQSGDIVQSRNKEGESVSGEVQVPDGAVIGWQGNNLGIETRSSVAIPSGPGIWDGSAFRVYIAPEWPYPGFTHPQPNREGNPPEEPFVNSFRVLGLLPSGEIVYAGRVEDEATFAPEVFWNEIGKADGNTFSSLLQTNTGFHSFFFELAPGGDGLFSEDPELEDGKWIWWLFDDSRNTIWERDQPLPGLPDLKTTFQFDRYRHPNDPARPFTNSRHIIGIGSVSPDGTGVDSFGAYFLVDPAGNKEFLFRDLGNPSPAIDGVVSAGTYGVSHLDMNENLDIAMTGFLRVEGETARGSLWLRRAGGELKLVATEGTPIQPVGSTVSTTFSFFRGVPWLDEAGNLYFEAQVEGGEGHTIWKYRAEDDLFERVGPVVGTPMPGVEGVLLESVEIQAMNASGRIVALMKGPSTRGYFLQTAEGAWCPFLVDNEVLVPGDPQTLSSNSIQDPIISENNQVAFTARINNLPTVYTVRIASEVQPEGDQYIWDGGAGTNDWHTVTNGRSNWADSVGTPWPTPPGGGSRDEEVIIGSGFVVELNQPAWVHSILMEDRGNSGLVINSELGFESLIRVPFLSELTLNSGKLESAAGILEVNGSLFKKTTGTFDMDLAILKLQGEAFRMEEGTLSIRNGETWFDGSTFTLTGGTLTLEDEVSRFQGDSTLLTVEAGNLNLSSKENRLESDTSIETQNKDSKIVIGKKVVDAQLSFVSEQPSEVRTLRIQGAAEFEFQSPFTLTETAVLERNLTGFGTMTINLAEGNTIQVNDQPFINYGSLSLHGGGITGKFENKGSVLVEAEEPEAVIKLECRNEGYFRIKSTVEYVYAFSHIKKASEIPSPFDAVPQVFLSNATIRPAPEGTGVLNFGSGARLTAQQGDNKVVFSSAEESRFAGHLDLREGTGLHFQNARFDSSFRGIDEWRVDENATLTLEDTECYRLYLAGPGETVIRGFLDAKNEGDELKFRVEERLRFSWSSERDREEGPPKGAAISLRSEKVRLENAELRATGATGNNTVLFSMRPRREFNYTTHELESLPGQTVEINGLTVGPKAQLHLGNRSFLAKGEIMIRGVVFLEGDMELEGDIMADEIDPGRDPRSFGFVVDQYGKLTFSGNSADEIVVVPKFEVHSRQPIVVESGAFVRISKTNAFDGSLGTLKDGVWVIEPEGKLLFFDGSPIGGPYVEIQEISPYANLTVSRPPAGTFAVNGFPLRTSNLRNRGKLTLDGVVVDFQGNSFINEAKGNLTLKNGAKILGNFRDVIDDIEGVIGLAQLNGAVDISGDAEINGVLGVGASPGSGVIGGDLTLSETSQMKFEIGGTEAVVGYDQVQVGGTAALAGKLILYPWDGYVLAGNEHFEFIQAETITGNFAEIDQSRLGRKFRLDFSVGETGLTAEAVPLAIASFAEWREAFFTGSDAEDDLISGPEQDPDRDGLTNRMEYFVSGNPNVPEGSPVTFSLQESEVPNRYFIAAVFDWIKEVADVTWHFETSTDLEHWTEAETVETQRIDNGEFNRSIVNFNGSLTISPRVFVRMRTKEVL
ncbi:MAG: hypothetical protein KJT03_00190 [Verrucomicrobiae bacterium]|nr:hypothetical protein [Verrucomicrobiae bacterium]